MKKSILKFLEYLYSVKNSSPHTISNYGKDLQQFLAYLTPPESEPPALASIDHKVIREFVGHSAQSVTRKKLHRAKARHASFVFSNTAYGKAC